MMDFINRDVFVRVYHQQFYKRSVSLNQVRMLDFYPFSNGDIGKLCFFIDPEIAKDLIFVHKTGQTIVPSRFKIAVVFQNDGI